MSRSWGSKLAGTMKSLVEAEGLSNRTLKGLELWTDLAPAVKANPEIMFAKVVVEGGTVVRRYTKKEAEVTYLSDG